MPLKTIGDDYFAIYAVCLSNCVFNDLWQFLCLSFTVGLIFKSHLETLDIELKKVG